MCVFYLFCVSVLVIDHTFAGGCLKLLLLYLFHFIWPSPMLCWRCSIFHACCTCEIFSWLILPLGQRKLHFALHRLLALLITPPSFPPCGSISCLMPLIHASWVFLFVCAYVYSIMQSLLSLKMTLPSSSSCVSECILIALG